MNKNPVIIKYHTQYYAVEHKGNFDNQRTFNCLIRQLEPIKLKYVTPHEFIEFYFICPLLFDGIIKYLERNFNIVNIEKPKSETEKKVSFREML